MESLWNNLMMQTKTARLDNSHRNDNTNSTLTAVFGIAYKAARVTLPALLLRCATCTSTATTRWRKITKENQKNQKNQLPLPLGFSAQRSSAASEGSSAAAPACGSPAGRSLSRAPGPQLAPEPRSRRDRGKIEVPSRLIL